TMAILTSAVLSFVSLGMWLTQHTPSPYHRDHGDHALAPPVEAAPATLTAGSMSLLPAAYQPPPAGESTEPPAGESDHADDGHADAGHADDGHDDGHHDEAVAPYTGVIWDLGRFGDMRV